MTPRNTFVDFVDLPIDLQAEARALFATYGEDELRDTAFWVKASDGRVSGHRTRLTAAALERLARQVRGDDVRSKTDLNNWTGSPKFSLDRSPPLRRKT